MAICCNCHDQMQLSLNHLLNLKGYIVDFILMMITKLDSGEEAYPPISLLCRPYLISAHIILVLQPLHSLCIKIHATTLPPHWSHLQGKCFSFKSATSADSRGQQGAPYINRAIITFLLLFLCLIDLHICVTVTCHLEFLRTKFEHIWGKNNYLNVGLAYIIITDLLRE